MTTLEDLCENIKQRQAFMLTNSGTKADERQKAWMLHDKDPEEMITHTYGHILTAVERKAKLTDLVSSLGQSINRKYRLKEAYKHTNHKVDEVREMHLGWFILIAYFDTEILSTKETRVKEKGKYSKHSVYVPVVIDSKSLQSLVQVIDVDKVELFPSNTPVGDWEKGRFYHQTGYPLIKNAHPDTKDEVRNNDLTNLLTTLNKLNNTGWRINNFVFDVFKQCKKHHGKTPFKAMKEIDPVKRASLEIEMRIIEQLAEKNLNNAFYHLYNCDFRGRIYPNTAFLHEQSSDNAKGLLLLDNAVCLGDEGYYWLSVHTANMWGNDKVSLNERAQWVQDNFDTLTKYVDDPFNNEDWMDADKPLCFLACCFELKMIYDWVALGHKLDDFPSCLPVYIDGSNNGVQHLAAMSADENVAPLVNLVPQDLPGDVYMFIAEQCIRNVQKDAKKMKKFNKQFDEVYGELIKLKKEVAKYKPGTELYKQAHQKLREYANKTYDLKKGLGPIFWSRIKDKKIWRKTVKRPVMVLGYGGTAYGMRDMVHEDTYDLSEYLRDKDRQWSNYLGDKIFNTCYEELVGPASMLHMFEALAQKENAKNKPVEYTQIFTNFPFKHHYKEEKKVRVKLSYGDQIFDLTVKIKKENSPLKKTKQESSTAPNIVHSVDAVHLTMTIFYAPYITTVVHDSFGCHAGNMAHMFAHVREQFINLYNMNPLEHIFAQMDALDLIPKKGTLDVNSVRESDYAFA